MGGGGKDFRSPSADSYDLKDRIRYGSGQGVYRHGYEEMERQYEALVEFLEKK